MGQFFPSKIFYFIPHHGFYFELIRATSTFETMKRLVTITLIMIILLQSSMKLAIVISFQMNRAFISSAFCENRAKPETNCHGKCYLEKKLKAEEKRERKNTGISKTIENVQFICSDLPVFNSCLHFFSDIKSFSIYIIHPYQSPLSHILQPPK